MPLTHTMDQGIYPGTDGADVTGGAASAAQAIPAGCSAIRFHVATAAARIQFGGSGVSVTASTGISMPAGAIDVFRIPQGATHFAYIGNGATINYVGIK